MKRFNLDKFSKDIYKLRKENKYSQAYIEEKTGISRIILGKMERGEFQPSIEKLEVLCELYNLDPLSFFTEEGKEKKSQNEPMNIAVAGTGYVGLSLAVLLAQHNHVTAVDVIPEKVEKINNRISPIQDDYIELYLKEKKLDLVATTDAKEAYKNAEIVIIATPTNYDSKRNFFDTKYVEQVIELVLEVTLMRL